MNLDQLVPILIPFLASHLDYVRGKIADSALAEAGKALVTTAKEKIFAKHEAAQKAADDLATSPQDPDNQKDFETQLRKALKADPAVAAELANLAQSAGLQLNITGDGNKTAIVQGQGNTVSIS